MLLELVDVVELDAVALEVLQRSSSLASVALIAALLEMECLEVLLEEVLLAGCCNSGQGVGQILIAGNRSSSGLLCFERSVGIPSNCRYLASS